MGLFSWFSSKNVESDSDILAALADSISAREAHLSEIRLRERRASFLSTLGSIALWILYFPLWFYSFLPRLEGRQTPFGWAISRLAAKVVYLAPVILGPILIYMTRRVVQAWYKRQENIEDRQLKKLRGEQKKKIEEIKAKHNFDKTRELLERYGDSPKREDPNMSIRQRAVTLSPSAPRTPARPVNANGQPLLNLHPVAAPQFAPTPARPMQPPRRGWMDKLADTVLGDDDSTVGVAQSRYALICEKCFSHNGLVKESEWETTQYICPKCGHFNPSAKAKKAGITTPPRSSIPTGAVNSPMSPVRPPGPDTSEPPSQDEPTTEPMDVDKS
ncbi:hypothetical protein BDV93DRAFT_518483 [Ceratobasidium sp. AG-I]|nr:hypothetical protein BDV93DRAFT_518483 [Ceratobasidium sp. AG-I]